MIVVVPYDDQWPHLFELERQILERVLARWLLGGLHHVGSTAVPGLAAKPVIDMVAGVRDLEQARTAFEPLAQIGYVHEPHRPEALRFHKGGAWWQATHALHLTEPGSDLWVERLAFRDALRADSELAADYERWKQAHASVPGEPTAYSVSKTPFVRRVLADAGI